MTPHTLHRLHTARVGNEIAREHMDALRPRFDRIANRHENGAAPRAVSAFNLFQTPATVAARLVGLLNLRAGARVLEPSAGLGRILRALPEGCEVVAVEHAPQIAAELFRLELPGVRLLQRDFLTCTPGELGLFDAIAMNPPFHLRADIRHILHARHFLKPGGTLAALCMAGSHRTAALRPLAASWEEIEAGAFKTEGTNVKTILLTIQA